MATITVRNLSNNVVKALKELAKHHHRSMEQEVRTILSEHVIDRKAAMKRIEALWNENKRKIELSEAESWYRNSKEWQI